MTGEEKLKQKILGMRNITIADCDRILTMQGYTLRKGEGSHRVYHKKGAGAITIVAPKGTKYIKRIYVSRIIKLLHLEE